VRYSSRFYKIDYLNKFACKAKKQLKAIAAIIKTITMGLRTIVRARALLLLTISEEFAFLIISRSLSSATDIRVSDKY
jgi:hypothetical protein